MGRRSGNKVEVIGGESMKRIGSKEENRVMVRENRVR